MRLLYIFISFCSLSSNAQLPLVYKPIIPNPTETIYIAPDGNDLNSGSYNSPKKTFSSALNSLSFGQVGVNGGNSYGEVIFKTGDYYPSGSNSFVQYLSDWRNLIGGNWVYKNISIRGLGKVVLHGDSLPNGSQMIYLTGSGIRVRNISIENSKLHGVAIVGSNISHHSNLEIDSVHINGAIDNGIWVTGYDKVLVQNSSTSNTCLRNYKGIGACNWASALRVENCLHASILKNKVYNNWGEGINTSYVKYTNIQDNISFDNYSINIYCHSSSNAVYSHNLVYNTDSTFWRYCHNLGGIAGTGISCANELSCTNACFSYGNSCGSLYSCCAELDYNNPVYKNVVYAQTDSVFIFNNIVLNAGISIWDNFSGFNNYANISNYFISHNTVIGVAGNPNILKPLFNISLGTPFVKYQNINIVNNIFSVDSTNPKITNLNTYVPNGTCNNPWQGETRFSNNLWNKKPTNFGINFSSDYQNSLITNNAIHTNLSLITPNATQSELKQNVPITSYILDDYFHQTRSTNTNIGAIEETSINSIDNHDLGTIILYPNPVKDRIFLTQSIDKGSIILFDTQGKIQFFIEKFSGNTIDISKLEQGIYFLEIQTPNWNKKSRIIINK